MEVIHDDDCNLKFSDVLDIRLKYFIIVVLYFFFVFFLQSSPLAILCFYF